MIAWIKKILLALLVAFGLYYLFTSPVQAAAAVKTFFGAFRSVGRFYSSLSH